MISANKRTILMPVYDGTVTKNLLRTTFLEELLKSGNIRIVIIPPSGKAEMYKAEFEQPGRVEIETLHAWRHGGMEYFFAYLYKHSIPTRFMKIRQMDWYLHKGQYFRYMLASSLRFMGRFHWWKKLLLMVNNLEPIPHEARELYRKWQPDLVFAPTMIPRLEVALMKLARRDGKLTVGMAKSFDNLTSKAYLRIHPDRLIVPNLTGVEEAVLLYDFPRVRVAATGICQYDAYVREDIIESREDFFKNLGLDPKRRTILYAPAGDWMNPDDKETLALILSWIDNGTLPNTQILLRLHPSYESATEDMAGHPHLVIERPGQHYGTLGSYEFGDEDVSHLASTLKHVDIVVNTASSLMVEGAIFDTPVISTAVDADESKPYWRSLRRYYDREHCVPVVQSKGMLIPTSASELLDAIHAYLADPHLHHDGRAKAVQTVCYKMDGQSCARTARVVIALLT